MQRIFKIFTVLIVVFFVSCKPESKIKPDAIKNIPSNIIVKEKSISGNFDSIVLELNFKKGNDSIFFDSLCVIQNNVTDCSTHFNYDKYLNNNYVYLTPFTIIDGFDLTTALIFDNNKKHVTAIKNNYWIINNSPYPDFTEVRFHYNLDKINGCDFGHDFGSSGCSDFTMSNGVYYQNTRGNDSLVLIIKYPSCARNRDENDTITVNFLPTPNNTNSLFLSFPTMFRTSTLFDPLANFIGPFGYLPLPNLNGKLIESVYFNTWMQLPTPIRYNFSYTFDVYNRVKTAKIYQIGLATEELIEFNY